MNIDPSQFEPQIKMIQNLERTMGPMIRQHQAILNAVEPQLKVAEMFKDFDRLIGQAMRETVRIQALIENSQFHKSALAFAAHLEASKPLLDSIQVHNPDLLSTPPSISKDPKDEEIEDLRNKVDALESALFEVQLELARKLPEVSDDDKLT